MNKKLYDKNLEALRGLASLMVVVGHLLYYNYYIDSNYKISIIGHYSPNAHFSVLIFFCLSGYVIGVSNKKQTSNKEGILNYLKKRFIRLYPIYLISLILIIPSLQYSDTKAFIYHLFFGQNLLCWPLWTNNPLWSLNYEVIFYILFIPISFFRISPKLVLTILVSLLGINGLIYHHIHIPNQFYSYLMGYIFWITGLTLSTYSTEKNEVPTSYNFLLSSLILIASNYYLFVNLPQKFRNYFNVDLGTISLNDCLLIPYCIYFILIFTNIKFRGRRLAIAVVYLLPLSRLIYLLFFNQSQIISNPVSLTLYLISLLFLSNRFAKKVADKVFNKFIYIGSISYAIYVIHFPILYYMHNINIPSTSALILDIKIVAFFVVLISGSIFLEHPFQSSIKSILNKYLKVT